MNDLEPRISKLEHDKTRITAIFGVLGMLGIGLAGYAAYLTSSVSATIQDLNQTSLRVSELAQDIEDVQNSIPDIPALVQQAVSERNAMDLVSSWSNSSVLAQLQAQAICTAVSSKSKTVMAILRTPTGKDSDGNSVSELCANICPRYIAPGTGSKAADVGAVHIYNGQPPFAPEHNETFKRGFATHVYPAGYNNPGFGPNYCCCGG